MISGVRACPVLFAARRRSSKARWLSLTINSSPTRNPADECPHWLRHNGRPRHLFGTGSASSNRCRPSIATFTHVGIGTVRTRPCFPTRSTMHQRPSRCWMCPTVSAATSERRRPQPRRTARIARSRNPFTIATSGALSSVCACRSDSQLPTRMPTGFCALYAGDAGCQFWCE